MKRLILLPLAIALAGLIAAIVLGERPPKEKQRAPEDMSGTVGRRIDVEDDHPWPRHEAPAWPPHCLLNAVSTHPDQPWFAASCSDLDREKGAVLVFNVAASALLSTTNFDGWVGFSGGDDLHWHPDGERLGTNVQTNGIALLRRAQIVGYAFPDETRDTPTGYVWVGDQMFSDTGALFEIQEGDWRFEFKPICQLQFQEIMWNPSIGAVAGRLTTGMAAFDPLRRKVIYDVRMDSGRLVWSADGRWAARVEWGPPDTVSVLSGDDGTQRTTLVPSAPNIRDVSWGPDGRLVVTAYTHVIGGSRNDQRIDLFRDGRLERTIDLGGRNITASRSLAGASGLAWSPNGDRLAVLLEGSEVRTFDAQTGAEQSRFQAPRPPIPDGLPDWYAKGHRAEKGYPGDLFWPTDDRIVRVAPHFIAVWSVNGEKLNELVVPTPRR